MFAPTRYLNWAVQHYGQVPFDLASSGMTTLPLAELGLPSSLDDVSAHAKLGARIAAHNAVTADEAVATLGTSHALWTAYASLLSPGDDLLLEDPSYEPMWRIAEGMGVNVVRFARPVEQRCALDPARVAAAMTPRTRLVAISNLHNPSGARASDDALREVARIAAANGAHFLVDEVYAPFDELVGADGVWPGSARRLAPNIVTTSSLTKCYGLGEQRIGWMLAPPAIIARARDALRANFGHAPLPSVCIGVHAFDNVAELAARARAKLAGKRALVEAWVAARHDITWSAPASGLFGLATFARPDDITERIERGAKVHGVLVAAGAFFGVPNGFRLSWSIDRAKLADALDRLSRVFPAE
jgi:aspartate/methionine/tyrosine aminotransferase